MRKRKATFTFRQREFARLFAEGMPAKEAAKAAGYAESTAETNAGMLLRNATICGFIDEYRQARRVVEPEDWVRMKKRLRRMIDTSKDEDLVLRAIIQMRMMERGQGMAVSAAAVKDGPEVVFGPDTSPTPRPLATPLPLDGRGDAALPLEDIDTLPSGEPAFDVRLGAVRPEVTRAAEPVVVRFIVDAAPGRELTKELKD